MFSEVIQQAKEQAILNRALQVFIRFQLSLSSHCSACFATIQAKVVSRRRFSSITLFLQVY